MRFNIDLENKHYENLNRILNRLLRKSRDFCDKYCIPDGLIDILKFQIYRRDVPKEILYTKKLSYDFDYYAFAKSTKTLHAIKRLMSCQNYYFNEDALILTRSIFENHLSSRYFREHIDVSSESEKLIERFIKNPIGIVTQHYRLERIDIISNDGSVIGKVSGPSQYKIGADKNYYREFYSFLCEFAHGSFGVVDCYFDEEGFNYNKNNYNFEALLFAIFTFTKILEGVATVEGENYETFAVEKSYYNLVYDSLEIQKDVFEYLIEKYDKVEIDNTSKAIQLYLYEGSAIGKITRIRNMLTKMRNSLDEEIGSLKKGQKNSEGKYIRVYPSWD